ncbi:SDR family NAD(P)-dependent oxidoreductase [Aquimarina sp. 2201CG5-10]|uniref:SDR family NAD(P)-dependent oxidoreductase n=1 Tax=Aquimarina callyspongiae TaxID=3098150 RepID=UPI002AB3A39A|nr:SDR family NAD(P)-dependent oxidoreductase [Aquimarina sp. 2201CG5-10]MDY8137693.1 SDR family NAD(P)-dependent oxidoreductase [Aquimarina sp. 2201CG5-10]
MKKAIVIGATSGIGKSLAEKLMEHNWTVGITGRRIELLEEIKEKFNNKVLTLEHDVTEINTSDIKIDSLFQQLETVDLVVVSSGVSELNQELEWEIENKVIQTNVNGIAKVYEFVFSKFKKQGYGHLVGISSIASIRGNRFCASYSASKAFQANYLEALRCIAKNEKLSIKITDIQPGFVDTPMAKGDGLFWVAPVKKATTQIYSGIIKEKRKVYITKRWRLIAWIMKIAPSWILEKM